MGTGDRGWRPGGLTPGYCLKPFQGFEDGLGNGQGKCRIDDGRCGGVGGWRRDVSNPEVIDAAGRGWDVSSQGVLVSKAWEVWRRDVSTVIEGLDTGWDVSSQKELWLARGTAATRRRRPERVWWFRARGNWRAAGRRWWRRRGAAAGGAFRCFIPEGWLVSLGIPAWVMRA